MRKVFPLLLLLSACATGAQYASLPQESPPSGMAQLIVYRPSALTFSLRAPSIELNGADTCDLPNGSFFIKNVHPGRQNIATSLWDMPGTSKLGFSAKPNAKYYVRIAVDSDKAVSGVTAGFIGMAVAEAALSHAGPFAIDLIDKTSATAELQSLKMNTHCTE